MDRAKEIFNRQFEVATERMFEDVSRENKFANIINKTKFLGELSNKIQRYKDDIWKQFETKMNNENSKSFVISDEALSDYINSENSTLNAVKSTIEDLVNEEEAATIKVAAYKLKYRIAHEKSISDLRKYILDGLNNNTVTPKEVYDISLMNGDIADFYNKIYFHDIKTENFNFREVSKKVISDFLENDLDSIETEVYYALKDIDEFQSALEICAVEFAELFSSYKDDETLTEDKLSQMIREKLNKYNVSNKLISHRSFTDYYDRMIENLADELFEDGNYGFDTPRKDLILDSVSIEDLVKWDYMLISTDQIIDRVDGIKNEIAEIQVQFSDEVEQRIVEYIYDNLPTLISQLEEPLNSISLELYKSGRFNTKIQEYAEDKTEMVLLRFLDEEGLDNFSGLSNIDHTLIIYLPLTTVANDFIKKNDELNNVINQSETALGYELYNLAKVHNPDTTISSWIGKIRENIWNNRDPFIVQLFAKYVSGDTSVLQEVYFKLEE